MQIRKLDHVAIKTAKLAETQAFFVEVLGLTVGPAHSSTSTACGSMRRAKTWSTWWRSTTHAQRRRPQR